MGSWNDISHNLSQRKKETLSSLLLSREEAINAAVEKTASFLCSPNDLGVMRNGGRNGSKYAPSSLMYHLSKMSLSQNDEFFSYIIKDICPQDDTIHFETLQKNSCQKLQKIISSTPQRPRTVHLGGGHDHIYPFAKAILQSYPEKKIHILNIDAHLDTRNDQVHHSGTPFRQLLEETGPSRLHITQLGIHSWANSPSSYCFKNKNNHQITFLSPSSGQTALDSIHSLPPSDDKTLFLLSLDCDAIDGAFMEGVSAVAPIGFQPCEILSLFQWAITIQKCRFFGIYEYNPKYDPSMRGAKQIALFLRETLKK